ncbi:hypothetical protein DH2020_017648 [Rehmannia glutinosa]|uniref:F-box domain-containing protein n=1 Tax=Rehmannia glutinosa TaxID=99300 RepID=A0ABR0WT62_REHGL
MGGRRGRKKFQYRRPKGKKNTPAEDSSSSCPPWIELPRDVTANILHRLGAVEILQNAQKVCTTWRRVCQEPSLLRVIDMKIPDDGREIYCDLDNTCRRAVDRSQGQLIDINIEYYGTDELLHYISSRSSHLKRLRFACCDGISGEGLTAAVKNFPHLEELHLFFMPSIHPVCIETISISCPMLKSFTFNTRGYRFPLVEIDNRYAVAVAGNMPNLRHLRLFGNRLNNEGLQAILDGCPHLESLDLRQCFSVDLRGDLGKRCSQQINDLRRPDDSTADYEWDAEIYDDEDDEDHGSLYDNYDPYDDSDIYSYENYDDYTNPFNDLDFPDNLVWYLDRDDLDYLYRELDGGGSSFLKDSNGRFRCPLELHLDKNGGKEGRKKFQYRRPKGKKNTPAEDSSSSGPPWIELPRDLTANILHRLGAVDILQNAQKVCTTWRRVCQEPSLWRVIDMKVPDDGRIYRDYDIMYRRAVDRSQGQLIDINIEFYGTDELLHYISNRSSHLKCLRLACCDGISGEDLTAAVKNFPHLEELHLFFMLSIRPVDIETIGISCPMLKSFTFNTNRGYRFPLVEIDNGYAVAVAGNMPNLRHLRLFGNRLNNEGVQAILDGCPHLESLDLRWCFGVYLRGELGKRCSQQIKDLRRPDDSTADYEWGAQIYDDEDDGSLYTMIIDLYDDSDIYSYENYDDYTNPFNDLDFPDNLV